MSITQDTRDCLWIGPADKQLLHKLGGIAQVYGIPVLNYIYKAESSSRQIGQIKRFVGQRDIQSVFIWNAHLPEITKPLNATFPDAAVVRCDEQYEGDMLGLFTFFCEDEYRLSVATHGGDHIKETLASRSDRAYLAVIVHALYRRKKIGPVNHFEEEQVLWKITNKGDVPFARKILADYSAKYREHTKSDRFILYKDGRSDGGRVYFLNPSFVEDVKTLCKEFELTLG